jgi:hypothetical protein
VTGQKPVHLLAIEGEIADFFCKKVQMLDNPTIGNALYVVGAVYLGLADQRRLCFSGVF